MRKVFTYSRKKPFSNVKSSYTEESSKENIENLRKSEKRAISNDSHSNLISSIISQSTDSAGNTPQTKRRKDIQNLLTRIDCKLKFLDSNENADFHKFYRHKNIILSEIRSSTDAATLSDLLELIRQDEVESLDNWLKAKEQNMKSFVKIGEATFSEVFKFEMKSGDREVVKIIPLELKPSITPDSVELYPLPINLNAAIHECTVLNEVSSLKDYRKDSAPPSWTGFNNTVEMRVLKGKYPKNLIDKWLKWESEKSSDNDNPDRYNEEQHFLIITMEDGGIDLEKFKFKNMRQVKSVVMQLVNSLALAEEHIHFEHRDLHLGNILVKTIEIESFIDANETFDFDGIQCNIIDYSLSRMRDSAGVAYRDLDSIEWLFEGDSSIDSQYQVYKDMKTNKGTASWKKFRPRSNILWLAFILERLVQKQKKSIQTPKSLFTALSGLYERILNYSSVRELKVKDEYFNNK